MALDPWLLFGKWKNTFPGKKDASEDQAKVIAAGKAFIKTIEETMDRDSIYRDHVILRIREACLMACEGLEKDWATSMGIAMGDFLYGISLAECDQRGMTPEYIEMGLEDFQDIIEAAPEELEKPKAKAKIRHGYETNYGSPFFGLVLRVQETIRPGWYRVRGKDKDGVFVEYDIQGLSPMRARRQESKA